MGERAVAPVVAGAALLGLAALVVPTLSDGAEQPADGRTPRRPQGRVAHRELVPLEVVRPVVAQDVELLLEGAPFCAVNPEFSPDHSWVATMELVDPSAPIPRFETVVRPFDRDSGRFASSDDGTTPSARLLTTLYGRPYFAQDGAGPYLVGDAAQDHAGRPMRTLTRWRPQLVGNEVVIVTEPLAATEPDHDPALAQDDEEWVPCRRSIFPYTEPGPGGRSHVWWFESDECASNRTGWLELYLLELGRPGGLPRLVERQAWDPLCHRTPACFLEWRGNLPMDISYARWVLGSEPAQLLFGSVTTPGSYGAVRAAYGDPAGGGPIELKRFDAASATSAWVTFDQDLKIAPFAASPERFVAGVDGAAAARGYAWSVDRFLPLHDLPADPRTSGLYDPSPADGWPSEPEGAASAETFLVRGVAEYAAFQLTLGGTFAWAGLPGEIWLGPVVSGEPWPISDADRRTARNEPEPVMSTDRRRAHIVYSAWAVDDPPFTCQQMRVVTVDFSCATVDLPPVADLVAGPGTPASSGSASWLTIDGSGDSRAVFAFDLGGATDTPRRADLVLLPDDPARPLPRLLLCDEVSESEPPTELGCTDVQAAAVRSDERWVVDASAAVAMAGPGVVTLAIAGSDVSLASKESGSPPILRLAFDSCEPFEVPREASEG